MAAKARIAVVGAGLMGHGIAQVFAVAGHEVTITDAVAQNLDAVTSRITANLRDLSEDVNAVDSRAPHAPISPTRCATPTMSSKPSRRTWR